MYIPNIITIKPSKSQGTNLYGQHCKAHLAALECGRL